MKLYAFVHGWLSPQQRGIQSLHAIVDLMLKAQPETLEWAQNHKTLIVLNGKSSINLHEIRIAAERSGYPNASFCEDKDSLENALTAVVVLPVTSDKPTFTAEQSAASFLKARLSGTVPELAKLAVWAHVEVSPLA